MGIINLKRKKIKIGCRQNMRTKVSKLMETFTSIPIKIQNRKNFPKIEDRKKINLSFI